MSRINNNLRLLALSLLGGDWNKASLTERLTRCISGGLPDPERLAARLIFHFDEHTPPSRNQLIAFLANQDELHARLEKPSQEALKILLDPQVMSPPLKNLVTFPLPQLPTAKDVREWLGLLDHELNWFADIERRQCRVKASRLHHYDYRWIEKRSGPPRLLEIPKTRLKSIQGRILSEILNRVPPHDAAHGFTRGRSTRSFVKPHTGQAVLLRMDLKDFFHSVPVARIGALFRRLGYPRNVARLMQGLCTHTTSASLAGGSFRALPWRMQKRLTDKHLPQGAPTSPALANLCAWRLDCRLQGVADRYSLSYTRYADDLAISGGPELRRLAPFLQSLIGAIALEEGFEVNPRKTRVQTQSQSQRLVGVVINEKANLPREEFDRLKAILHNCIRYGPASQNRQGLDDFKAHLAGKLAYVRGLNPARGERLQRLWSRIQWPGTL